MTSEQTATRTATRTSGARSTGTRTAVPRDLPSVAAAEHFSFAGAPAAPAAVAAVAARGAAVPLGPLWAATGLAVVVLSAFLVLIVSGRVVTEGPVVAVLTRTHGVHAGDLYALAAWCLAVGVLVGAALTTTVALRRR